MNINLKRFILFFLISLPFVSLSFAQGGSSNLINDQARTYGYIVAQDYKLSHISKEFPDLSLRVELTRLQFESVFPEIKTKLKRKMIETLGESRLKKLDEKLYDRMDNMYEEQEVKIEEAIDFLDLVKRRSEGEIESPVLENLLAVKYKNEPVQEYVDGYRQRYKTDGLGKSQGVKLILQLPYSWIEKDGERPHIVKKWINLNGVSSGIIMLDVRDAEGVNLTKTEVKKLVGSGEIKEFVPEGATYTDSGYFFIEKQHGYWIQMEVLMERITEEFYQPMILYQFYFQGKAIGLMCSTVGFSSEKIRVDKDFDKIKPLCLQVLNSLVLVNLY